MSLDTWRLGHTTGFGMAAAADGYLYRPTAADQIADVFEEGRKSGRQVVLRGAGRSYGDASILPESVVLDCTRMDRILEWDPTTGLATCEPGVTIEGLWRGTMEDGFWPPVVSGTMFPTLAGTLGMNIHGKNNFREGTLGEHVQSLEVVCPNGETLKLTPEDPRFYLHISGAGQLGAISKVTLKLKRVPTGLVKVLPVSIRNWEDQFAAFESHEKDADYMVSWVDMFAKGKQQGRGEFHAAWYASAYPNSHASFKADSQDLPDTILGFLPKSMVWRLMKPLNNRPGTRFVNTAKYKARRVLGDRKLHEQSLVGFSFLLDYVPGWRNAYLPGGFIQYQCFVPRDNAPGVFRVLTEMQQSERLTAFLGVMKLHRADRFNFSHGVDGYSLALDFKHTERNHNRLWKLCHQMNDMVLANGGKFYLAKDSTLRPDDFAQSVGKEAISLYFQEKRATDPEFLLTSSLSKRLKLDPRDFK